MAIQMKFKSKSNSFFRSLFHIRETQTPPVNPSGPEFPELVHVSYYHDTLQSTSYISNPNNLNSHKVVELVRFKTAAMFGYKQHQQVVAKVETGEPDVYGYVCFERARQTRLRYNTLRNLVSNSSPSIDFYKLLDSLIEDGMPINEAGTVIRMKRDSIPATDDNTLSADSSTNASTRQRDASSDGSSDSDASISTEWSGLHSNADDTVSRLSHYPSGIWVKPLESLKPINLRLCDLAILVAAVHDLNAVYSIFHAQRFWFANLIMRIVEKDHDTLVDQEARAPVFGVGRYGLNESSKDEVCSGAGRWYNLRVDRTLFAVVEMIRVQYDERRRNFDKRLRSVIQEVRKFPRVRNRIEGNMERNGGGSEDER